MDGGFYQVNATELTESQMREIARYIAVELQNPQGSLGTMKLFLFLIRAESNIFPNALCPL